jgi:hypothetical protein
VALKGEGGGGGKLLVVGYNLRREAWAVMGSQLQFSAFGNCPLAC